jgi:predicted dehydrogenase
LKTYRAAVIGCSRIGGFIDNEVVGSPNSIPPISHAAAFEASERTDLIACSDLREDVMEKFGERYNIPKERQYTDYEEMIAKEGLDIVSVATQPEHREKITVYAADHGVKAIYAEKAMAASMAEADSMVEACERNGVYFNLGTNRRWNPGYDKMKELIDGGELGALKSLISYSFGSLFNTASHWLDLLLRLNSDHQALWVQGQVLDDGFIDGTRLTDDPRAQGMIQFENGVTAYCLQTGRGSEHEAVLENGVVTAISDGLEWQVRRAGPPDARGRPGPLEQGSFPSYERSSSALNLVNDLAHSLDTGEPPRGGVRVARQSTELIFAFIESHQRGGERVDIPLKGSGYRLERVRTPRQPKYEPAG